MSIFDLAKTPEDKKETEEKLAKERALQEAMLELKHKYGKNAVVKAKNLNKGGTAMERNEQIGGHKA
jgi:DNA polymerase V